MRIICSRDDIECRILQFAAPIKNRRRYLNPIKGSQHARKNKSRWLRPRRLTWKSGRKLRKLSSADRRELSFTVIAANYSDLLF